MQTQPIDFHPPTEDAPSFLLPNITSLFSDRARRFETLAEGHGLGDWLRFLARLSRAQHEAIKGLPELPLPDKDALSLAQRHHMPPLNAPALTRPPVWRDVLRQIVRQVSPHVPEAAQGTFETLLAASDEELDKLADTLLAGEPDASQLALLPFVGAGLQVVFTALASRLDASHLQQLDAPGVCPCCGNPPVASLVRLGAAINNLRYLHCSLCNTEWNVPRAICTVCVTDKEVALYELESEAGKVSSAVRAETCDTCKSYLKITYQEKDHLVDPVADDLATLVLDMLVDEAGYERSGFNLLLMGGNG
ncbi:MAG: formate dehydrogenase accessory protein FdhE [Azovibrio sp.]